MVPPPSPSDTNPPLGPAILATAAARAGFHIDVLDLNIVLLKRFGNHVPLLGRTLGDHGKDRRGVAAAAQWLFAHTGLRDKPPLHLPDTADPVAGMHYPLSTVTAAVAAALSDREPWRAWLEHHLLASCDRPPTMVGVSLMGPSQVFVGLLVLRVAKQIWPETTTALGGSHVTLLREEMRSGGRLGKGADVVLPGHCEDEFVAVLARLSPRRVRRPLLPERPADTPFEYLPSFSERQLRHYDRRWLTLPLQFTRGCSYGRCTFCTYPLVEPLITALAPTAARATVDALVEAHGVRRFSLKDSLFTAPMLRAFAQELLREPAAGIRWSATTKANRALISMAPLVAASGLATVEIGVETIRPEGQRIFDKRADPVMLQELILALAEHGITVVTNLIFGYPGEQERDAQAQLAWFLRLRAAAPAGRVDCSLNMLEMVRGAPMVARPPPGVELRGVAPWAFSYAWNAPGWRRDFADVLRSVEQARQAAPPGPTEMSA
ncbi:radical SAM protein [Micromonospora sp. WMMD1082]|uniref:B12-binding domain-containing radical SAM protein n=1 Tax=Micromonospora sp. WMMD1082 TaxID=3016104 RepID=UPI0024179DF6|nr:radical SAM protein [Micromonospora sp. WMMD1082]MDG4798056.1 radical SAM protein [Micromonospora sp. WMMD1082]